MAKFKVGDKVKPVPYDVLSERGLKDTCGSIYGIWDEAYKELCRGVEHTVLEVDPSRFREAVTYSVQVRYKCGDIKRFYLPEWALEPVEPKLTIPEAPKFCFPMTVDILGTEYSVVLVDKFDDDESNFIGGFTDPDLHLIKIRDLEKIDSWKKEPAEKIEARQKEILRHEIVHAYLDESGLKWCTLDTGESWSRNEEMVDWFAIQGPKVMETWKEAGCL